MRGRARRNPNSQIQEEVEEEEEESYLAGVGTPVVGTRCHRRRGERKEPRGEEEDAASGVRWKKELRVGRVGETRARVRRPCALPRKTGWLCLSHYQLIIIR
jgi:hypothetical protein